MIIASSKVFNQKAYATAAAFKGYQVHDVLGRELPFKAPERDFVILDAACGTGLFMSSFMRSTVPIFKTRVSGEGRIGVIGIDVREAVLSINNVGSDWSSDPEIASLQVRASVTNIPLEDGSVDFLTFNNVLEHLYADDRLKALTEAHRVLGDDGVLMVLGPVSSPFEKLRYNLLKLAGNVPHGPVSKEDLQDIFGENRFWEEYMQYTALNEQLTFKLHLEDILDRIDDPLFFYSRLLELYHQTPLVVDYIRDADHKVWFSPRSLLRELRSAGFDLCEGGTDYFDYRSTQSLKSVLRGDALQHLLPLPVRKLFAHGGIFVLKKSTEPEQASGRYAGIMSVLQQLF